jgi:hypothetical protein
MTAVRWQIRPSLLLEIDDGYTAYCFDEACAYIVRQLEDDKEPKYRSKYTSFSELYAGYTNGVKQHVR